MTGDWLPSVELLDALDNIRFRRYADHQTRALIALGWAEHTWAGLRLTAAGRELYEVQG